MALNVILGKDTESDIQDLKFRYTNNCGVSYFDGYDIQPAKIKYIKIYYK